MACHKLIKAIETKRPTTIINESGYAMSPLMLPFMGRAMATMAMLAMLVVVIFVLMFVVMFVMVILRLATLAQDDKDEQEATYSKTRRVYTCRVSHFILRFGQWT